MNLWANVDLHRYTTKALMCTLEIHIQGCLEMSLFYFLSTLLHSLNYVRVWYEKIMTKICPGCRKEDLLCQYQNISWLHFECRGSSNVSFDETMSFFASFLTSWRRLMTHLHLRYVTLFDHTIHLKYVTKKIWQCKSTFRLSGQTTIWLHGIPKGHFPVYAQISSSQSAWVSTFRLGQSHTSNSLYNVITNKSYVLSYWGLEGWSFFQYEVNEVSGVNLPTLKNSMKL